MRTGSAGLLYRAGFLTSLALAALTTADVRVQAGDLPSFTVTFPRYQYKESIRSVREVDFRNLTLHAFDERGAITFSANLSNGKFVKGAEYSRDEVAVSSIGYLRFKRGEPQSVFVIFTWISVGGSSTCDRVIQVFELISGHLTVSQQITFICSSASDVSYDPATTTLTVKATHYANSDAHCCPSRLDIVTFRWTGRQFEQESLKTVPIKSTETQSPKSPR